ncbi:MAG: YhdP family protein, partial [Acidiferrobacteraceae bacterium]
MPLRNPFRRSAAPHEPRTGRHRARGAIIVLILLVALAAAAVVGARMALTSIVARPALIARILSRKTGRVVRVRAAAAFWDGIHPGLMLTDTRVEDTSGRVLLAVPRLKVSLAWSPLLFGRITSYSLTVVRPVLSVRLRRSGAIEAGGVLMQAHGGNGSSALRLWLLDQHDLSIRDAQVTWIDRQHGERVPLRDLNILAQNRFRHHKVDISADFPPGVCAHCAFLLDVSGSPRSLARVSGEAYAHLQGVHIAHLPWILRHYLPPGSGGRVDVQVWSRWRRGAPVSVKGTLVARDLTVPANRWTNQAHVSVLAGDFAWHGSRSAWTLEVQHGRMGGASAVWKFGHLLARVGRQGSDIQLSRLDLDQVSWFLAHARVKSPLFTALGQIDPDGLLQKVRIRLQGPVNAPRRFWLDASASRLAAAAYGPYPGFNGIDGVIKVYNDGGTFVIRSMKGSVFWPRYFKKSLTVDSATGDLSWTRGPQGWSVHSKELSVRTADGALRTGFTLGLPKASPSTLDMHLTAADVDLAKIRPLYEAIPKPQLRHWLRS